MRAGSTAGASIIASNISPLNRNELPDRAPVYVLLLLFALLAPLVASIHVIQSLMPADMQSLIVKDGRFAVFHTCTVDATTGLFAVQASLGVWSGRLLFMAYGVTFVVGVGTVLLCAFGDLWFGDETVGMAARKFYGLGPRVLSHTPIHTGASTLFVLAQDAQEACALTYDFLVDMGTRLLLVEILLVILALPLLVIVLFPESSAALAGIALVVQLLWTSLSSALARISATSRNPPQDTAIQAAPAMANVEKTASETRSAHTTDGQAVEMAV